MENLEPIKRTLLDLDSRFFPAGIKPNDVIELRGPEGSGKTFTLTYLLARFLFVNPTKMAILIDTCQHFNLHNLISILTHLDERIKPDDSDLVPEDPKYLNSHKLLSYLKRFFVIRCFNFEELVANFIPSPPQKSQIERMLLANSTISLVLIDSIDAYVNVTEPIANSDRMFFQRMRSSLESTSTPLIGTRTTPYRDTFHTQRARQTLYTQTLDLVPLPSQPLSQVQMSHPPFAKQREKEMAEGVCHRAERPEVMAYLGLRTIAGNPNPSSISGRWNHALKLSIFSGMLWVVEPKEEAELEK